MLVLSRKCQESVVVGGAVGGEYGFKVTVVEVRAGRVRLGFDGDPDVPVHRWEVWERIRAKKGRKPMSVHTSGAGVEVCTTSTSGNRNT